jgi:hypothetical protein
MSARALAEAHSVAMRGELMVRIVIKESPSRMRGGLTKLDSSWTSRREAFIDKGRNA